MPREIRIISIRGFSKDHLAKCDEFGEPGKKTLCGVYYEPIHRTGNRPIEKQSGRECKACLRKSLTILYPERHPWSKPEDLEVHLSRGRVRPACGQDCAGPSTLDIKKVTCAKCKSIAEASK
jgi:hypothetical protein